MTRRRIREIHEWITAQIDAGVNLDDLAYELNVTRDWLRNFKKVYPASDNRSRGGGRPVINQGVYEKVLELADGSLTIAEVARYLDLTPSEVSNAKVALRKQGYAPKFKRATHGRPVVYRSRYDEVLELADGSLTIAEVANRLSLTWSQVNLAKSTLRNQGFDPKFKRGVRGGRKLLGADERKEDMKARRLRGESLAAIGRVYGLTRERIRQILSKT